jgi:hypothetical protein
MLSFDFTFKNNLLGLPDQHHSPFLKISSVFGPFWERFLKIKIGPKMVQKRY